MSITPLQAFGAKGWQYAEVAVILQYPELHNKMHKILSGLARIPSLRRDWCRAADVQGHSLSFCWVDLLPYFLRIIGKQIYFWLYASL